MMMPTPDTQEPDRTDQEPADARSADTRSAGTSTAGTDAMGTGATGTGTAAKGTEGTGTAETGTEQRERLFPEEHARSYGSRWDAVKGTFVDEPREAVAQADALVGEVLDELEELFREQRRTIEQNLDTDETSTEDLRLALRRYRSFFDRLLSI
jgi:hypothetical protein